MQRTPRIAAIAGTAIALFELTPHPAMAQQPASDGYLKAFAQRHDELSKRLDAAVYLEVTHNNLVTDFVERYPCDLEAIRSLLPEMESLARETRGVADAATAAGEFATVEARGEAGAARVLAQSLLDRGHGAVVRCERRNRAPTGVRPEPAPPPSTPLTLPDPLEAMLTQTASRARYLELRRMAEPGAKRPVTPAVEDILGEIGDGAAVRQARECRAALVRVPPPFAAAVLAAGARADDKPDEWFPAPEFNDVREAAVRCAPVAESKSVTASHKSLAEALAGEVFEKIYGTPPPSPRARPQVAEDTPPPRPGLGSLQDEAYHSLEFWGGIGEADIPQTGIGVTRNGPSGAAPETDAGRTADKISMIGFGGAFDFGDVRVRARYAEGDARTAFDVQPISGGFNGAVSGGLSPDGNAGIGGGSVTLKGTTEVDLSQLALGADFTVFRPTPTTSAFVTLDYVRDVRRHDLSLTGTASSGSSTVRFSQQRNQRIRDDSIAVGIGGTFRAPISRTLRAIGEGRFAGYFHNTDLRSVEHNESNFGPSGDRDYTIAIDRSASGFGVAAAASAELDYALSPGLSIFAGAKVDYRSRTGTGFNPNTGDKVFFEGLTTDIGYGDSVRYGARIGLRIRRW